MTATICKTIETIVIRPLLEDAIAAGYTLGVDDGEEIVIRDCTDPAAILDKLFSVGEEHILFYRGQRKAGWVFLVHGNSGWDVVSDYSTNLEPIMARCAAEADRLSE